MGWNRSRWLDSVRLALGLRVVIGLLMLGGLAACSVRPSQPVPTFVPPFTPTPQPGEVYTVQRGTLSQVLEVRGRVVARREEMLFFPLGGYLKALEVQVGQTVQAGQIIAELDAASLEDQLLDAEFYLQRAEGELARARTVSETLSLEIEALEIQIEQEQAAAAQAVAEARGELNIATAELQNCQALLTRYQKAIAPAETEVRRAQLAYNQVAYLWNEAEKQKSGEAVPPPGYAQAVAALESATLKLEQAKDSVTAQQAECEATKAELALKRSALNYRTRIKDLEVGRLQAEKRRLEKEQEINRLTIQTLEEEVRYRQTVVDRRRQRLAEAQLRAPFDGVIVSVEKRIGEELEPYDPLGAIADPSAFRVEATVLEEDILKLAVGQPAVITLDAYADTSFEGTLTEIGSSPIVWQGKNAYTVYLDFVDPVQVPASIRMGVDIRIRVTEKEDVLRVPVAAVIRQGTRAFVTRLNEDGSLEQVEVELGASDGQWIEVLTGLRKGQKIQIP